MIDNSKKINEKYTHGGDIYGNNVELDFSINVNPLGTPKKIIDAVKNVACDLEKYPDFACRELKCSLSKFECVPEENIVLGNGASELIFGLSRLIKNAEIIEPTFIEYRRAVEINGGKVYSFMPNNLYFEKSDIGKLDFEKDIFLCNPNNPTGHYLEIDVIEEMAKRAKGLFIIDECFIDFVDFADSAVRLIMRYSNLVILKAFTKNYSIAGLRLGYLITSNNKVLDYLNLTLPPWRISTIAQVAGKVAIEECSDFSKMRDLIRNERQFLIDSLTAFHIKVYPTMANFILIEADNQFKEKLLERKILIRRCDDFVGLSEKHYRIAVRTHEQNVKLIKAISEIELMRDERDYDKNINKR